MEKSHVIEQIAVIRTPFKEKFGIPRQSGIVQDAQGIIEFEPEYRDVNGLRGLEGFSHIWLIWGFSENYDVEWSPLVRPPRLGGKTKVGVWASRSPYRPNGLGLSVVEIVEIDLSNMKNPKIIVRGVDMLDGTPVYDIKPYAPYSDSYPDAKSGFAVPVRKFVDVADPEGILDCVDDATRCAIVGTLEQDPRAAYDKKPGYEYGMRYENYDVKFTFREDGELVVTGIEIL